jgi:hypothetical protein
MHCEISDQRAVFLYSYSYSYSIIRITSPILLGVKAFSSRNIVAELRMTIISCHGDRLNS